MAKIVQRTRLRALEIHQVINMATREIDLGNTEKWSSVRRIWNSLLHGAGNREECETRLAWAMGYHMIGEDIK